MECLWNLLDSFVICFCSWRFGPDCAQHSIAFLSFWTHWPIETSHEFIQLEFVNKKHWEDHARSESFQHKLQHRCFQLWRLPAFKTRLLYKPWFVGIYSEKLPFLLYIFILSGQSRDKASLNNYKGILFGLPRKKTLYYFRLKAETLPDTCSECLHVVLVIPPGCKKGSPWWRNLDSWVENQVLHGNIYSSITQRLFSSIQGGQRLITSERRSVVLSPLLVKTSNQSISSSPSTPPFFLGVRFKMVFVSVVFLVTLKLNRERKKVSLLSLKFCNIFFSSE